MSALAVTVDLSQVGTVTGRIISHRISSVDMARPSQMLIAAPPSADLKCQRHTRS